MNVALVKGTGGIVYDSLLQQLKVTEDCHQVQARRKPPPSDWKLAVAETKPRTLGYDMLTPVTPAENKPVPRGKPRYMHDIVHMETL